MPALPPTGRQTIPAALAREWLDAQEAERRRIARDLHDDLGQLVLALRMDALALAAQLHDPRHKASAEALAQLAKDTLARVRGLARQLRPPQLDTLGLVPALQALCADLDRHGPVRITLEAGPAPHRADPAIELAAYRIAQEALGNALRHAHARHVRVELEWNDPHGHGNDDDGTVAQLRLQINDDGHGHDPDAAPGLGRLSMRERAALAGGVLEETSSPAGTRIRACLPLRMATPDRAD